jgi:hypothetical protein
VSRYPTHDHGESWWSCLQLRRPADRHAPLMPSVPQRPRRGLARLCRAERVTNRGLAAVTGPSEGRADATAEGGSSSLIILLRFDARSTAPGLHVIEAAGDRVELTARSHPGRAPVGPTPET